MRFITYWAHQSTNEVLAVLEQEVPFAKPPEVTVRDAEGNTIPTTRFDLGMVDEFVPSATDGTPCNPAAHIHQRLEHRPGLGPCAKDGHTLPAFYACPATMDGVKALVREKGPSGVSAKMRAWLTYMLPDEAEAMGLDKGIPVSALKAMDALRQRRDVNVGSRLVVLERAAQESSDARSAQALRVRKDKV